MKPSTREWIKKAEADYQLALSRSRRRKVTFHDHGGPDRWLRRLRGKMRRTSRLPIRYAGPKGFNQDLEATQEH